MSSLGCAPIVLAWWELVRLRELGIGQLDFIGSCIGWMIWEVWFAVFRIYYNLVVFPSYFWTEICYKYWQDNNYRNIKTTKIIHTRPHCSLMLVKSTAFSKLLKILELFLMIPIGNKSILPILIKVCLLSVLKNTTTYPKNISKISNSIAISSRY